MVRYIILLSLIIWSTGVLANGGSIALDNLILHKQNELHQTRKARGEEVNAELNRFFDEMIRTQEKDLKKMSDLKSKLFPGTKSEEDQKYISDDIARELRKVEKELYEVAKKFQARLEKRQAQEETSIKLEFNETPQGFEVKAEIPGVPRENIKVDLNDNALTIEAQRKEEVTTKKSGIRRSEFSYGEFKRIIELPRKVNAKSMKIDYKDGILRVHLDKV
jgi:HSP20 family protein